MNPDQIRALLAEISAKLEGIVAGDTGYTAEQVEEIETLNAQFEGYKVQLDTAEKVESMKAATAASARKTQPSVPKTEIVNVQIGKQLNEKFGGFNSTGEFLMAVKRSGQTGDIDKRFLQASTAYEKVGEDGGFLVPEEIGSAILKKLENPDESLMARANVTSVSGNALTLPIDESQPWNSGIRAYWTEEGTSITESKAKFSQASWRLQKLAALVKTTDELLDDATALSSYILNAAPNAIMYEVNKAIINGNGVGKPTGFLNSSFAKTVSKVSMQTNDTVVARNVVSMYSHMLPGSRSKAVWLINPEVEEQLRLAVDDNDEFIYMSPGGVGGQLSATPFGTLLGRPVIPLMGGMPALGDLGDIAFVDLSYYYMIRKAGIKSAQSIHLLFDKEQTAFRFSLRLDGKCPFKTPVTTEFGSYDMSGIVLLEARGS